MFGWWKSDIGTLSFIHVQCEFLRFQHFSVFVYEEFEFFHDYNVVRLAVVGCIVHMPKSRLPWQRSLNDLSWCVVEQDRHSTSCSVVKTDFKFVISMLDIVVLDVWMMTIGHRNTEFYSRPVRVFEISTFLTFRMWRVRIFRRVQRG